MDDKDLKNDIPVNEKNEDIIEKKDELLDNSQENSSLEVEKAERPSRERRSRATETTEEVGEEKTERPPRERRERTVREPRERRPRAIEATEESGEEKTERAPRERTVREPRERRPRTAEATEEVGEEKTERAPRERRERTVREPRERRERTAREPRERRPRTAEATEEGGEEKTERAPRERRERTAREPRERKSRATEATGEERAERAPREKSERPSRERGSRAAKDSKPALRLFVGSSPHLRSEESVKTVMRDVVIALMPALFAGIYFFGLRALTLTLVSILSAVGAEYIYERLAHKKITIGDYSAVITGLLLAYNVPVTLPYWMIILGSAFAIIVVKQLYGGIGMNFMNPALAARAALMASFPSAMSNYIAPSSSILKFLSGSDAMTYATIDATTYATPLSKGVQMNFWQAFIGVRGGCIGEVSALCLLIGAAYLLYRKTITIRIPLVYILTTAVVLVLTGTPIDTLPIQLLLGGLILGAFFMATDYVSAPVNRKAQIFYAMGCGIITALIRNFGALPEGVSYSILFMNLFTPLLEKYCVPKVFGEGRVKK